MLTLNQKMRVKWLTSSILQSASSTVMFFTPLQLRASFISGPECSGFQKDWFKVLDSDSCSTN